MNSRGPRTEPWGTPEVTGTGWEVNDFNWMNWVRPERYEWNQFRGVFVMPREESLSRRMVCEIVSKAAIRSSRRRMDSEPKSAARRRSLVTLRSAVSVLWRGRKPDWNCSYSFIHCRTSGYGVEQQLFFQGFWKWMEDLKFDENYWGYWDLNQVSWVLGSQQLF